MKYKNTRTHVIVVLRVTKHIMQAAAKRYLAKVTAIRC